MNTPTLDTVKDQAEQLSYSDKILLIQILHKATGVTSTDTPLLHSPKPRIAGLHAGKGWIAEDFDAPLPDSFWLGEDEA